jgi:hypothetical protein
MDVVRRREEDAVGRWELVCALVLVACGDKDGDGSSTDADDDGVAAGDDCNDGDASIHPGADERCNEIDDDCDGTADEDAVDAVTSFTDADADGYGRGPGETACVLPAGRATEDGDCDDANRDVNPGAVEICNDGIDDDCDGPADDDDAPMGTQTFYDDGDGDGYGAGAAIEACEQTKGLSLDDTDCNDGDAEIHPGATEMCNGVDDDCDATTGEDGTVAIGATPYDSIQQALDASAAGDTVTICGGTFFEKLDVKHSVVLEGRGADLTTIDGEDDGPVVSVSGSSVDLTLRDLGLRHGFAAYVSELESAGGGGVQAYRARSLTIQDCLIEHSEGEVGGGVLGPDGGNVQISGTEVSDNAATAGAGAGLLLFSGPAATIEIADSEISDNTSSYFGGGVVFFFDSAGGAGRAEVVDTLIDGNDDESVDSFGGGMVSVADLTLSGVTLSNNGAYWGGGGAYVSADVEADDTTEIIENFTSLEGYGGGLFVDASSWSGGTVSGNLASMGGGAFVRFGGQLTDAIVDSNSSDTWGGGIFIYDGGVLENVEITNNESYDGGGGMIVSAEDDTYDAVADSCLINNNIGGGGGGGAQIESPFESIDSDWGSGSTDNDPDDVLFFYDLVSGKYIEYDAFGASSYFECSYETHVCD